MNADIARIRGMVASEGVAVVDALAAEYRVKRRAILRIVRRETWSHVP